jgi:hypothetical protein
LIGLIGIEFGETYAIVAYGDAATVCLDVATKPLAHCGALICFYPSEIPKPNQSYPTLINLVVHLTESQGFAPKFPYYNYAGVEPGFAERDLDQYDNVAAELSWSRSLKAVRKGLKREIDLEDFGDTFLRLSLKEKDAGATISLLADDAYVNYTATATGGVGKRALLHFYRDFFMKGIPPSMKIKLISRTTGVDRVIDEMLVSFRHSQEMPWILPGVPPTDKLVEIGLVSIIGVRGGKLVHEHIYWDQASVLMQIGALDPKHVPQALRSKGCKQLPVMGAEAARKIADARSVPSNVMIPSW